MKDLLELSGDGESDDLDKMAQESEHVITKWLPASDLLSSDKFAKQFVVEIDNEGNTTSKIWGWDNGQKPESKLTG